MNNNHRPIYIIDSLFFLIENGQILVWNYKTHEQYQLKTEYFSELLNISSTNKSLNNKICEELLEAKLITSLPIKPYKWEWDILSRIFHIGTQNIGTETSNIDSNEYAKNYIDQCTQLKDKMPAIFIEKIGDVINLPEPDISLFEKVSFLSVLKNRKTCRSFNSEFIGLDELSLILYCSFGLIHGEWDELNLYELEQAGIRKSSPSSGATHSEEVYITAYRVSGLTPGLYHYRPQDHKLTLLKKNDFEDKVIKMNYNQYFSKGLSFGIYLTSRLEKIWWKYKHSRAYRAMLLDIGHVSQTFLNSSTALGLQTWITGAFHDTQVEDFLDIQENQETVILFVGAGKGSNQSIPSSMIEQLQK